MRRTSDLAPFLTQKPIILIVEDQETKECLYAVWGADQQYFNILTCGGHDVVKGIVEDLRKHDHHNVFGLVDRDFGASNVARWLTAQDPPYLFQWSFHELENILLDWTALAGCDLNQQRRKNPRSANEIEDWARDEAQKQPWWLACRKCLSDIQKLHGEDFPSKPGMEKLSDLQGAVAHITGSFWFRDLQSRTTQILNTKHLESELQSAYSRYCADLAGENWIRTFSGKEIYKRIRSRIHESSKSRSAELDVDLAKSVGKWQLENSAVPPEVDSLKTALKTRVGI